MKILVTGGAGFIGSNFVCHMLDQGHEVINVDKLTYAGNLENLGTHQDHLHHHFYKVDICDKAALEDIFKTHRPEVVIHMAAESHVDRSIDCADEFIQTNIVGTHTLLETAFKYFQTLEDKTKFRFIHLSTDEVFGALGEGGIFNEMSPYQPNSPYAASKASSDLIVRSYNKTYGFPTIIINSSNNYGPKQFPEKLIPLTIMNALELKTIPIYDKGQQVRDWLYVDDHVCALESVISEGKAGESYCVGSDNEWTNLAVVEKICVILDDIKPRTDHKSYKELIAFVKDRPGHDYRYATDASKLKKTTGWQDKIPFEEGLKRTIEWYMKNTSSPKESRKKIGLRGKNAR